MEKGTHGIGEKSFEQLTYADQARSLNAQIQIIEKALRAHFRKGKAESKDVDFSKTKYKTQLLKVINSLE
jgi:hypothetical protein